MAAAPARDWRHDNRSVVIAALAIPVVIILMLLAFLAPSISSGAEDLPLSVSGPEAAVTQLETALDTAAPGAFDITTASDADAVTSAVENREAIGGIAVTTTDSGASIEVVTASGAGSPYATLLKNLATGLETQSDAQALAAAKAQGADAATLAELQTQLASTSTVTVTDVAPLTADDPSGVGLSVIGLPLVFGGMASGALLALVLKVRPSTRALGAVTIAVLGSLLATLVLQTWFGSIAGSFLLTWAGLAMGIAAISLTLLGLHACLGPAGFGLGAILMLFIANPLAGLATGPQWLPAGWGTLGQLMPVGAAGTWLRSAAYFDGAGMGWSPWVLACWIVLGLCLLVLGGFLRNRRAAAAAPAADRAAAPTPTAEQAA